MTTDLQAARAIPMTDIPEEYRDIAAKWADYAVNFDGEGMTVTFAPYEIACYAAGTQEFRLDRDFLGQYLSAEGLRLLGYEE